MPYDKKLWCTPVGCSYLYERHEGLFFMEEDERVDMRACIDFFKKLDPKVKVINTFAGSVADIIYINTDDGWRAFDPPKNGQAPQPTIPMVRH